MLKEPTFEFPLIQGKSCICLKNGQYFAYLDWNAAVEFAFGLHWFARDKPLGEELDIWSQNCDELRCEGTCIGLCEFNLVPTHRHKKQGKTILKEAQAIRHKPHGIYDAKNGRLDYFVSPDEVEYAYEMLTTFLTTYQTQPHLREVTLFETLVVRLVRA